MVHILMFGTAGPIGSAFAQAALAQGHQLTLYIKARGVLPGAIGTHPNVKVYVYETIGEPASIERVMLCGASHFVSFIGPMERTSEYPVTETTKYVFHLLVQLHYQRALFLGTTAYIAPQDKTTIKWKASIKLSKMGDNEVFQDFANLGAFLDAQPTDLIRWTLFRVHHLIDGPGDGGKIKPVIATFMGSGQAKDKVTKKGMVNWVLDEMFKGEWVGKAPLLCH